MIFENYLKLSEVFHEKIDGCKYISDSLKSEMRFAFRTIFDADFKLNKYEKIILSGDNPKGCTVIFNGVHIPDHRDKSNEYSFILISFDGLSSLQITTDFIRCGGISHNWIPYDQMKPFLMDLSNLRKVD